nr:MAG TPA: hypothetical protein [Caudoviricetes sp.]
MKRTKTSGAFQPRCSNAAVVFHARHKPEKRRVEIFRNGRFFA